MRRLLKQTLELSILEEIPRRELTTINQIVKGIGQVPSSSATPRQGGDGACQSGLLPRCDCQPACSRKKAGMREVRHRVQEAALGKVKQKQFGGHQPGAKAGFPIYPLLNPRIEGRKNLPVPQKRSCAPPRWDTLALGDLHLVVSALCRLMFPHRAVEMVKALREILPLSQ